MRIFHQNRCHISRLQVLWPYFKFTTLAFTNYILRSMSWSAFLCVYLTTHVKNRHFVYIWCWLLIKVLQQQKNLAFFCVRKSEFDIFMCILIKFKRTTTTTTKNAKPPSAHIQPTWNDLFTRMKSVFHIWF